MNFFDRMLAAKAELEKVHGLPLRECRLHPDDYKALREQCESLLQYDAAPGSVDSFAGVKIVEDESAQRLPRLKTPNYQGKPLP